MLEFLKSFFGRKEKRELKRYRLFETLYVHYTAPADETKRRAEGLDISEKGIRFASEDRFNTGDEIRAKMCFFADYPEQHCIPVTLKVTRCYRGRKQKRYRVACTFNVLSESESSELAYFLDWLRETSKKYLHYRYGSAGLE